MRRRLLLATLAASMLIGPFLATAGPYAVAVRRGTAAMLGSFVQQGNQTSLTMVPLSDGSRAFAFLFESEPTDVTGNFIFPEPNPKVDATQPKQFIGCILIIKSAQFDGGCEILSPSYIETDPTFGETTVVFSVQSFLPNGFRLTAALSLDGQGSTPEPMEAHAVTVTPSPPERPTFAFASGTIGLTRGAIARGSIRSDLLGGGAVVAGTTANSMMMSGLFGFESVGNGGILVHPGVSASIEPKRIVCLGTPPNVTCYPF